MELTGVIRPGTSVYAGPGRDIECEVISFRVHSDLSITYQVEWFNGSAQCSAWKTAAELETRSEDRLSIGFRQEGN